MAEDATGTRTVVVERQLAAPAEKIWRALTQPHLIEEWLMKNDFKPEPGHRFNLRRDPSPEVSVVIDCEVLTVEPNRSLSYSWSAFGTETVVTFTLTPTADGTLLRVEQEGFTPDQRAAFKGSQASWRVFLAELDTLVSRID
ncbi:MAG: SRPBCC domain-containing protein [Hyphomicrobium sp.]